MYTFTLAVKEDLEVVYRLINERMDWMVLKGIKQWDKEHYWSVYPKSYYAKQVELGQLYVLKKENEVVGAIVLYDEDDNYKDNEPLDSFYLHNFVTSLKEPGAGKKVIFEVEELGKRVGKQAIRLDCLVDNQFLNDYYEQLGYDVIGEVVDGIYHGIKREKLIAA